MPAKRVIPCLDVRGGRVVKGRQFMNLRDSGEPQQLAARYCAQGADELVMLDVAATIEERLASQKTIEAIARSIDVPLTVGGGVQSMDDFSRLFAAGADRAAVNTAAILTPSLISQAAARFGSQAVVVAIDAMRIRPGSYRVATHSATRSIEADALAWAVRAAKLGAGEILFTCVHADGMQTGFDLDCIGELARSLPVPFIASGGAKNAASFVDAFTGGADAALAASVFHDGLLTVGRVKRECSSRGITVRW